MSVTFSENDVFDVESITKLEQTVKDFNYKRRNSGFTNADLEVKRINLRVDKMLLAHEKDLHEDDIKLNHMRKFYNIWKGARPDKLGCLKEIIEEDMTNICCVEVVQAYEKCFQTKEYFHNIKSK